MDPSRPTHAVVFVNGDIKDYSSTRRLVQPGDFLVAVDGGLRHLQSLNLVPGLLIGDLDSVSEEDIAAMQSAGVEIKRYPVEKNETDLELTLLAVAMAGWRTIRVAGGLGGRLDQTLGNLFLLMLPDLEYLDLRLDDGREEVWLVRSQTTLEGHKGDVVSLLPLNGPASGIITEGLYYPLQHETLYPEHSRGISNVMLGEHAAISVENGLLLCIHTRG